MGSDRGRSLGMPRAPYRLAGRRGPWSAQRHPHARAHRRRGQRAAARAQGRPVSAGMPVEKSEVVMGEGPLRRTGEHEVLVHLHADVETTVKVIVTGDVA